MVNSLGVVKKFLRSGEPLCSFALYEGFIHASGM
jgi:hypothetical protein